MSTRETPRRALLAGTPWRLLGALAAVPALGLALAAVGLVPVSALPVVAVMAGQAALLATTLAWAAADAASAWDPRGATSISLGLLAVGAVGRALGPSGALASLATPLWLWRLATRGRLRALGVVGPEPRAAWLVGVALGTLLGAHLLLTASRTLGHPLRDDGPIAWLTALAYDVGVNVPVTEAFFRGALFGWAWRRWPFAAATALSAAACVVRYLVDPLLPRTLEVLAGTVLYVALLSVANAWLRAWSGSVLPGCASALVFFAAWRALALRAP